MVINYKRLNNNAREDIYKFPDKNKLINRIQEKKLLVKSNVNKDIDK